VIAVTCSACGLEPCKCAAMKVLDYINCEFVDRGRVNVDDDTLRKQIAAAIRRGHPQMRPQGMNPERVVIVGGGPSLESTEAELVDLVRSGAKLVTLNGAYQWCLERNLSPRTQIVVDARAGNDRFLYPAIPDCNYVLASQCHPTTWDAVEGRPRVFIFHAVSEDSPLRDVLDAYYVKNWVPVSGGTTVASRAIALLRTAGYLRFDLFGVDSCWLDGKHHAYDQPENERDQRLTVKVEPTDGGEARTFQCAPWHLKQFEDFLQFIRFAGQHFLLNVHGDGLLAHALRVSGSVSVV
jgi:hypothetical protein